jgi:hypothetical protein
MEVLSAIFKAHRGQQDLLRWIGRLSVLRKRLAEAWMDLFEPVPANHPRVVAEVLVPLAQTNAVNANISGMVEINNFLNFMTRQEVGNQNMCFELTRT